MTTPLAVLIVEDSEDDMALIVRALQRGGYDLDYERVETAAAMSGALDRRHWDLVIADHNMPHFSAPAALTLLKDRGFEIPFVIVSGAIGEDIAVAAMKAGAQDYIMKSNLARLAPAVERELREAADRRERQRAETALSESEQRFRIMADSAPALIWMAGPDKFCYYFNRRWLDFTGRASEQEKGYGWMEGVHRGDFQRCFDTYVAAFDRRESFSLEYRLRRADGQYRWLLESAAPRYTPDGSFVGYIGSCVDITERKQAEAALELRARQQAAVAELGQRALAGADLDTLIDEAVAHIAAILEVEHCKIVERLPGGLRLRAGVGWEREPSGSGVPGPASGSQAGYTLLTGAPAVVENLPTDARFKDRFLRRHGVVSGVSVIIPGRDEPFGVLSAHATSRRRFSTDDIHFLQAIANVLASAIERARDQAALQESQSRLVGIIGSAMDAIVTIDARQRITLFNAAAERMFRCSAVDVIGQPLDRLIPDRFRAQHHQDVDAFGATCHTRRSMSDLGVVAGVRADGEEFPIEAAISQSQAGGEKLFTVIMRDISLRRRRERAFAAIGAFASALRAAPPEASLPALIVDRVAGALDADSVALAWRAPDDQLVVRAGRGRWADSIGAYVASGRRDLPADPAQRRQPPARPAPPASPAEGAPSVHARPLLIAGETAGMIWVGRDAGFAEDELRLLAILGDLATLALGKADLDDRLRRRSDELNARYAAFVDDWRGEIGLMERDAGGG